MKRIYKLLLLSISCFMFFSNVFALPIETPHRYFEIGTSFSAGASNNMFSAKQLLVKELVLDLRKIADEAPAEGLLFNLNLSPSIFMNLNLKNNVRVGIVSNIEAYSYVGISKDFFDFIGKGNKLGEPIKINGSLDADVFYSAGIKTDFYIKDFYIKCISSFFLPIMHSSINDISLVYKNTPDGKIKAEAGGNMSLYTFLNLEDILVNKKTPVPAIGVGFDLGISMEHQIFERLQGELYMRTPIVPGKLSYCSESAVSFSFETEGIRNLSENSNSGLKAPEIKYKKADFYLNRPFKLGYKAVWNPFGKWHTFSGLLGFGIARPFSKEALIFPEYDFSTQIELYKVLGLKLSSAYYNRIFTQSILFMLNLRILEFNTGVIFQGADFANSWKGSGAGVFISFAMGF